MKYSLRALHAFRSFTIHTPVKVDFGSGKTVNRHLLQQHPDYLVIKMDCYISRIRAVRYIRKRSKKKERMRPIDIYVKREGAGETPLKAKLLDFGLNARIKNFEKGIKKGDDLRIFFSGKGEKWFHVNAEVVEVSKNGKVSNIRFTQVNEESKKLLIGPSENPA